MSPSSQIQNIIIVFAFLSSVSSKSCGWLHVAVVAVEVVAVVINSSDSQEDHFAADDTVDHAADRAAASGAAKRRSCSPSSCVFFAVISNSVSP